MGESIRINEGRFKISALLFHHSSQKGLTWSCVIPLHDSSPDSECRTVVLSVVVCPWGVPASRIGIHQQKFPAKNFWLKFQQTQNRNVSIQETL